MISSKFSMLFSISKLCLFYLPKFSMLFSIITLSVLAPYNYSQELAEEFSRYFK